MNKLEAFMNEQQLDDLDEVVLTAHTPVLATPTVTLAGAAGVTGVVAAYVIGRTQGGGETGPAGGGGGGAGGGGWAVPRSTTHL